MKLTKIEVETDNPVCSIEFTQKEIEFLSLILSRLECNTETSRRLSSLCYKLKKESICNWMLIDGITYDIDLTNDCIIITKCKKST